MPANKASERLSLMQPSRRDVQRVAVPGSLIVIYENMCAVIISWLLIDEGYAGSSVQHRAIALVFDAKKNGFVKPQQVHWTTVRGWLFGAGSQLESEVIDAADPER